MRIHGNKITDGALRRAAMSAGMANVTVRFTPHGSRSRALAYEVQLRGTSPRRANSGRYGADTRSASYAAGEHAATWDEWGMFLAALFDADPSVTVPRVYDSAEHFHWATGDRFRTLTADRQHRPGHRWEHTGESATGAYSVSRCRKCNAIVRYMMPGRMFAELSEAVL
jgi:hypothetical protein